MVKYVTGCTFVLSVKTWCFEYSCFTTDQKYNSPREQIGGRLLHQLHQHLLQHIKRPLLTTLWLGHITVLQQRCQLGVEQFWWPHHRVCKWIPYVTYKLIGMFNKFDKNTKPWATKFPYITSLSSYHGVNNILYTVELGNVESQRITNKCELSKISMNQNR